MSSKKAKALDSLLDSSERYAEYHNDLIASDPSDSEEDDDDDADDLIAKLTSNKSSGRGRGRGRGRGGNSGGTRMSDAALSHGRQVKRKAAGDDDDEVGPRDSDDGAVVLVEESEDEGAAAAPAQTRHMPRHTVTTGSIMKANAAHSAAATSLDDPPVVLDPEDLARLTKLRQTEERKRQSAAEARRREELERERQEREVQLELQKLTQQHAAREASRFEVAAPQPFRLIFVDGPRRHCEMPIMMHQTVDDLLVKAANTLGIASADLLVPTLDGRTVALTTKIRDIPQDRLVLTVKSESAAGPSSNNHHSDDAGDDSSGSGPHSITVRFGAESHEYRVCLSDPITKQLLPAFAARNNMTEAAAQALRWEFDGGKLHLEQSFEEQDMENEDLIDVRQQK